jgi:hypothetical protein
MTIRIGSVAPAIAGASQDGPHGLVFYKVTCPTCQMAAAPVSGFERAYPYVLGYSSRTSVSVG